LTITSTDPDPTPNIGIQYFLPDGETLPFWKLEMPYRGITIVIPAQASCRGWYIKA